MFSIPLEILLAFVWFSWTTLWSGKQVLPSEFQVKVNGISAVVSFCSSYESCSKIFEPHKQSAETI